MHILSSHLFRTGFYCISVTLLLSVCLTANLFGNSFLHWFLDYSQFLIVGLIAATIANSTGAGGGIVFLPAFTLLGLTAQEALATSFAIQCFGMTSGALAWLSFYHKDSQLTSHNWVGFFEILIVSACASVTGILVTQYYFPPAALNMHLLFSWFSLVVGLMILLSAFFTAKKNDFRLTVLSGLEYLLLVIVCFIGGAVTAWLSIGVGEILAIFLIFLGYRTQQAIAIAVCVSSVTVIAAIPYYINQQTIELSVLMFAAPAALIGGALARRLAVKLGAYRLKVFMACWIIISAIVYMM